jgi:hypothetical protein
MVHRLCEIPDVEGRPPVLYHVCYAVLYVVLAVKFSVWEGCTTRPEVPWRRNQKRDEQGALNRPRRKFLNRKGSNCILQCQIGKT